jgi:hypothetical protein
MRGKVHSVDAFPVEVLLNERDAPWSTRFLPLSRSHHRSRPTDFGWASAAVCVHMKVAVAPLGNATLDALERVFEQTFRVTFRGPFALSTKYERRIYAVTNPS